MSADTHPALMPLEQVQAGYRANASHRQEARLQHHKALKRRAEANHEWRKMRATAFAKWREQGKPVEESKIRAESDAADAELRRDMADVDAKTAKERIDYLEAERATLRQLADWSKELDRG